MASEVSDKKQQSKGRKCPKYFNVTFRIILFAVCVGGTFRHVREFLEYYWTWPEVVDITIETDREVLLPTVTVCYTNIMSRKIFCGKNPSKCVNITKESETCREFPHYCAGEGNITLVKDTNFPTDIINFVHENGGSLPRTYRRMGGENVETWPARIYEDLTNSREYFRCYSVKGKQKMKLASKMERLKDFAVTLFYYEDLHFEMDDLFSPQVDPGVYFHIHSPFVDENPMLRGIFLRPGKKYNIQLRFEEEHHLPSPYKSDCFDYISQQEENGGKGPRSIEDCLENCMKMAYCRIYGALIFHERPFHLSYCNGTYFDPSIFKRVGFGARGKGKRRKRALYYARHWGLYYHCAAKCKSDCVVYKYPYSVKETDMKIPRWALHRTRSSKYTDSLVTVDFDVPEVLVMKHKPQYQAVELFSYLGGFLGIWLGLSLFSLADLLDNAFNFMGIFLKLLRYCICFKICRQNNVNENQENAPESQNRDASQSGRTWP